MEELCSKEAENDKDLRDKIRLFVTDRSIGSVTGIRRMGRENLVRFVAGICAEAGIECTIYPDTTGDTVIFYHWERMNARARKILEERGDVDILFGQDLCHQVPAVVRWDPKESDVEP